MNLKVRPATILLVVSSFLLLGICAFLPFIYDINQWHVPVYSAILFVIGVTLFLLYLASWNRGIVTPVGFFMVSLLVFILARPYLYFVFDAEIVEIGNRITFYNILLTVVYIAIGLVFIVFGFLVFRPEKINMQYIYFKRPRLNSQAVLAILIFSVLLMLLFLRHSYEKYLILKSIGYASAFELGTFHNHLAYFFLAKQFMLVWVFFSQGKNSFLVGSFLLFLGSIGFVLIGLRGYTFAYFFLFLYFLNERKKINILYLAFMSLGLIYIAALVLEFRVGFDLFDSVWEIIPKTFHQQGASFEVVFGAAIFPVELRSCISVTEYFSGKDFGGCVDKVRGLDWEFGGFASSFFAEAIYLGFIPYLGICLALGFGVKYLDYLSRLRSRSMLKGRGSQFIGLVLFATIPNLIYFGRSSAFDFIVKLTTIIIILIAVMTLFSKRKKAEANGMFD